MSLFNWSDNYSVKVTELDNHHKELINILNELYDAMSQRRGNEVLGGVINRLISYTRSHFATEERYMQKFSYPAYTEHKKEHEAFLAKVQDFHKGFLAGELMLSMEVSTFLKNWLVNHISGVDKKYGSFFNEKGLS